VTLSVHYLDKGDCKVSLIYDSGDEVVRVNGRVPGACKPGGEFQIGNFCTLLITVDGAENVPLRTSECARGCSRKFSAGM